MEPPLMIGTTSVRLTPHYLPGVGAQVFVHVDDAGFHMFKNWKPDDLEALATHLKIAACQADALAAREQRKHKLAVPA